MDTIWIPFTKDYINDKFFDVTFTTRCIQIKQIKTDHKKSQQGKNTKNYDVPLFIIQFN